MSRQEISLYTVFLIIFVLSTSMVIYALRTGWVLSRFDWIDQAVDPVRFWNWVTGYALGAAGLPLFLWMYSIQKHRKK